MTPQEQQLISQLFDRLKAAPAQAKDPEADALIRQGVTAQPDTPYLLVQTVLIQDMALGSAQARIADLEQQVEAAKAAPPAQPTSFLGSLLGRGSVPAAGARQMQTQPQPQQAAPMQPAPAWGAGPQPMMGSPWSGGGGSGFLRAAAATALGVAGGELLFSGVRSMFGSSMGGLGVGQPSLSETVVNNYYGDSGTGSDTSKADYTDADTSQTDPDNVIPADYDTSQDYGDTGGSDFGGDDSTSI
jgi:uncharacterized protein